MIIEWRWAEGKFERLPELAADLVRVGVDVIVTGGPQATRPARDATSTVPIVMGFDNDPVGAGFIVSLARPGRNITGLSSQAPEITGKQLELLREIVPRLSRVAVLGNSAGRAMRRRWDRSSSLRGPSGYSCSTLISEIPKISTRHSGRRPGDAPRRS